MVSRVINLGLRALEFFFMIVVLGLIGAMIAQAFSGNPATVNYNMFVAVFAVLSLFYLIPASWNDSFTGHPLIPITLDALNTLFIFAGATALAAGLGVHSCGNSVSTLPPKRSPPTDTSSLTPRPTISPMEPTILRTAAARPKLPLRSSISLSPHSQSRPS